LIRPAEPHDASAIRAVHRAAFPTSAEADLVGRLGRDAVVSLVADRGGEVAGHLVLSRMQVSGDGRSYRAVALGPVGVLPEYQRAGMGSELIEGALAIAGATGEELVFVLGEPEYYARFGFDAETAAPFVSPYAGPFLMALKLRETVALPKSGTARYAEAFGAL
jgi:putative acetyltransferase